MVFSPFSTLQLPRLGKKELILVLFVVSFDLRLFGFVCLFPLPLGVWEELRLVIVARPELFSYLFLIVVLLLNVRLSFSLLSLNAMRRIINYWLFNQYMKSKERGRERERQTDRQTETERQRERERERVAYRYFPPVLSYRCLINYVSV